MTDADRANARIDGLYHVLETLLARLKERDTDAAAAAVVALGEEAEAWSTKAAFDGPNSPAAVIATDVERLRENVLDPGVKIFDPNDDDTGR